MEKVKPRTLSGFMELLPAPQVQMERIMQVLRETYALYGFYPLDTPLIEASEVLLAKLQEIDALRENIRQLEQEIARLQGGAVCPVCGAKAQRGDVFCRECGGKL